MPEVVEPPAGAAKQISAARRWGYRIFPGDAFSYLLHLRPREWPIVAGHTLFGFLLASTAFPGVLQRAGDAILGTLLFVVLLNGGTLAINSAFDRDEGDIGYLDAPPSPPPHLLAFGLLLMTAGQILGVLLLSAPFALVYAACFVMSVLYSVPPFRWKAIAGLDVAINAVGFGTLTPLAGWALSGVPVHVWGWCVLIGFGFLFTALYPMTQLYQVEEDRARGDRTLAIRLGIDGSLRLAAAAVIVAFLLHGAGLLLAGRGPSGLIVLLPLTAWGALIRRWLRDHPRMAPADHKRAMYAGLRAWALTDAALLLAFAV